MKPLSPDYYAREYGIPLGVAVGFLKHGQSHEEAKDYIYKAWMLESKGRVEALEGEKA